MVREVVVREIPFVSLFTGAGGLDLGLERASLADTDDEPRFTTALACESDPCAFGAISSSTLAAPSPPCRLRRSVRT